MKKIVLYIIVMIVAVIPYVNSLKNPLVWDDMDLIFNDPNVKELKSVTKFFTKEYWRDEFPSRKNTYRPLRAIAFTVDYALWKKNSSGYHLTNMLLNTIAVVLAFKFAEMLSGSVWVGLITSIIFATLPVHVEAVSWVKNRSELLCFIFFVSSLILFGKWIMEIRKMENGEINSPNSLISQSPNIHSPFSIFHYLFSIFFFILALMSKENAVILPFVILVMFLLIQEKINLKKSLIVVLPYFLILAVYTIFNYSNFKMEIGNTCSISIFSKDVLVIPTTIYEYIKILLWPFPLNPERDFDVPQKLLNAPLGISLILIILTIVMVKQDKTQTELVNRFGYGFGLAFILITLIPISNIINLEGRPLAEQRLYLPSFGFAYILGLVFGGKLRLGKWKMDIREQPPSIPPFIKGETGGAPNFPISQSPNIHSPFSVFLLSIVLMNGLMTFSRNYDWRDMRSLLEKAVIASPFNARAKVNLATTYRHAGEYEKAIQILEALREIAPDYVNGLLALGRCYEETGRYQMAIDVYEKILKDNPNSFQTLNQLGMLYVKKGKYEQAIETYEKAIKLSPESVPLHYNIAVAYEKAGNRAKAIEEYELSARFARNKSQYYSIIGMIYENQGEVGKAIEAYKKAIDFEPDYVVAMYNLGMLESKLGKYDEALQWFLKVEKNLPQHIDNLNNIGIIYDILGNQPMAISYFNKAININANDPKAYYNRAQVYLKIGEKKNAKQDLVRVLQIEPGNVMAKRLLSRI